MHMSFEMNLPLYLDLDPRCLEACGKKYHLIRLSSRWRFYYTCSLLVRRLILLILSDDAHSFQTNTCRIFALMLQTCLAKYSCPFPGNVRLGILSPGRSLWRTLDRRAIDLDPSNHVFYSNRR